MQNGPVVLAWSFLYSFFAMTSVVVSNVAGSGACPKRRNFILKRCLFCVRGDQGHVYSALAIYANGRRHHFVAQG